MSERIEGQSAIISSSNSYFPLVLLLFFGSGCSALIYEVVWFQLLQLVIGSSAVSLGVLLGTYMGGMCLGSIILPRIISRKWHPLRVYALLELGVGIIGIIVLYGVPQINNLYTAHFAGGFAGILLRAGVCAICLIPPTLLMGATLPAIARWVEMSQQGVSWLGFFYGGNIAGAVLGCLLAGFYLLRIHDIMTATYSAAAINFAVAVAGIFISFWAAYDSSKKSTEKAEDETLSGSKLVYVTIAISGMSALGAEVIWTRILSLMLGATVYTFSIILAVFLVGLGIGSSIGSLIARHSRNPRLILGYCQMLLTVAIAWTAYVLLRSMPYWPIDVYISTNPWFNFQIDILRCIWAVLLPAILWGASFPLALGAVATKGRDPGYLVGGVYAANTIGAIFGAVGFSMLIIPMLGTQRSQQLLIGLSAVSGLLMLLPLLWPFGVEKSIANLSDSFVYRILRFGVVVGLTIVSVFMARSVAAIPWKLIAHGRNLPVNNQDMRILYTGEGMNASIAVTEVSAGIRNFHVSGKVVASSYPQDMRLQRMLGHIPALFHPDPKKILVVGCGAGVTAGSFLVHPEVEKVVICEIEPLIPKAAAEQFGFENYNVVNDPRVEIVYDDARHYILTTDEKFDIITSDPIHPWVKGAAALYTEEYFELSKERLNPGGIVTQWVPLYESTIEAVKSEIATFFNIFPYGTIWSNDSEGYGYDIILLGQEEPMTIDVEQLQARLDDIQYIGVQQSIGEVGFDSAVKLLATYAGRKRDLEPWLADAQINLDRNMRLQYLAGLGLNNYYEGLIFDQMSLYREFPGDLFIATDDNILELLSRAIDRQ